MDFVYEGLAGLEVLSPSVYLLVLLGGIISALSICYVPVLVMFSGYMGGQAKEGTGKALRLTGSFTAGMAVTSAAIGMTAAFIGQTVMTLFTGYSLDVWIPAVIGIFMGLQLLGLIRLRMPRMLQVETKKPKTILSAFAIGLPFGLVITPCTIPIFFMIIAYVAAQGSAVHGAFLLLTYAFGKGLVLGLVSVSSVTFLKDISRRWGRRLEQIAGVILIAASLYLIFFQVKMPMP